MTDVPDSLASRPRSQRTRRRGSGEANDLILARGFADRPAVVWSVVLPSAGPVESDRDSRADFADGGPTPLLLAGGRMGGRQHGGGDRHVVRSLDPNDRAGDAGQ